MSIHPAGTTAPLIKIRGCIRVIVGYPMHLPRAPDSTANRTNSYAQQHLLSSFKAQHVWIQFIVRSAQNHVTKRTRPQIQSLMLAAPAYRMTKIAYVHPKQNTLSCSLPHSLGYRVTHILPSVFTSSTKENTMKYANSITMPV